MLLAITFSIVGFVAACLVGLLLLVALLLAAHSAPPQQATYEPPPGAINNPLTITPVAGQRGVFTITNVCVEDLEVMHEGAKSYVKAVDVAARFGKSNDTTRAYRYIADRRIRYAVERALFQADHDAQDQQTEP